MIDPILVLFNSAAIAILICIVVILMSGCMEAIKQKATQWAWMLFFVAVFVLSVAVFAGFSTIVDLFPKVS